MKKFEFYFSLQEYYKILPDAVKILKHFTALPSMGCWKEELNSSYVLIFIATKKEHEERIDKFLKVCLEKLGIAHYVGYNVEFFIERIET